MRLNSWKEIAAHLGCDVSTAQRWEKERGLPVRRVPGGKRQSVFALSGELDGWMASKPVESPANVERAGGVARSGRGPYVLLAVVAIGLVAAALALRGWRKESTESKARGKFPQIPVAGAQWIAAADMNEDGIPDFVVSGVPGRIVSIVLGDGKGGASSVRGYEACELPRMVATADFDGDGHADVVAGCSDRPPIVYWGDGSGRLGKPEEVNTGTGETFIIVAELEKGRPPKLIASDGRVMTILGARGRTFTAVDRRIIGSLAGLPATFAVGDFDGDGLVDVVVGLAEDGSGRTMRRFLNAGDGRLRELPSMKTSNGVAQIAVGDFNEDGHQDLALGMVGSVEILMGRGKGDFETRQSLAMHEGVPIVPVAADFNGDGHLDLAFGETGSTLVDIYYGDGKGGFQLAKTLNIEAMVYFLRAADVDGDGRPDLVVSLAYERVLTLLLNRELTVKN